MEPRTAIGKLQFKTEDGFWNAYYAEKEREPVFLGGISTSLTDDNNRRQMQFAAIMQDLFADMVMKKYGILIGFDEPINISYSGGKVDQSDDGNQQ